MATRSDSPPECLAIVGVGLIGASIGLAARRDGRFRPILGVGRDNHSLDRAKSLQCVDETTEDLAHAATRADVLVICTRFFLSIARE
jgi:prephenate dehydrogenase